MMETIYLVVAADRHTDDGYEAFSVLGDATEKAGELTKSMEEHYSDKAKLMPNPSDPWVYHASLEDAGSVTVVRVELK